MATFEPPLDLFRRQVDSIRAQTHTDWVCVISDDCSAPDRFAALEAVVADDDRFVVSRSPRRLGFYRNFERALALRPGGEPLRRPGDQDDAWHPDKLATLRAELGDARLVYSDARVVGEDGRLRAGTYWSRRAQQPRRSALPARGELGERGRDAVPARPARRRAALPAGPVRALPRPLARPLRARHRRDPVRRPAALRLRPARRRDARARGGQPHDRAAGAGRRGAPRPARADPAVAHALLRRRLPAAAARRRARAALRRPDGARQAPRARRVHARRALAGGDRPARGARRARSGAAPSRDARGGVDAVPRVRVAPRARPLGARRTAAPRSPGRRPAAGARSAAGRPRDRRPGAARAGREGGAAAPRGARRRSGSRERAHPDVRPAPLLRRLHRQAQPRAAAGGAGPARAGGHRRPGRRRCRGTGPRTSSATAGSRGCSTGSRSPSAARRRAWRCRAAIASWPRRGGPPTSPPRPRASSAATPASST